jgi:hypothetical protein
MQSSRVSSNSTFGYNKPPFSYARPLGLVNICCKKDEKNDLETPTQSYPEYIVR